MMKLFINLFILTFISSCLSKGQQNIEGENNVPQDITISLLKISPPSVVTGVGESTQFTVAGGNEPYTYRVSSGLGAVTQDGLYVAPNSLGTNTVEVTDGGGNTVYAIITVGSSLQASPTSKTMGTSENFTISALGGVAPYTFAIVSGNGSINSSTGEFTSDASPGTVSISITDSNNEIAYSNITVVDALTVTPSSVIIEDSSVYSLSVAGGAAPYTYQVYAGTGTIDANGNYTAPATPGTEIIRIIDSNSNYVEATINVALGPTIAVTDSTLAPAQEVTFSSSTGTAPFTFTVESGSGTINPMTGDFVAPSIADLTTIRVTDTNGFFEEMNVQTYNLKKVAIGEYFKCMVHVKNDNTTSDFKCWGYNEYGNLGNSNSFLGDAPGEMGDNLDTIDFGSGYTPIGIYSGRTNFKCALFSNGKMKCWGYNNRGQLGIGHTGARGQYANQMGNNLSPILMGGGYTIDTALPIPNRATLGSEHACVAVADDNVKCFGYGANGRLGYGNTNNTCHNNGSCGDFLSGIDLGAGKSILQIAAGHQHTCALIAPDNQIKCWGEGGAGRLGYGNQTDLVQTPDVVASFVDLGTGRSAQQVVAGIYHTCALLDDNTVKCWGDNAYGQLGIGSNVDQGDNGGEMGDSLQTVDLGSVSYPVSIHTKGYHTCAIFNNGGLKCWGYNAHGQLGLGNSAHRGDGGGEMGDNLPFIDFGGGSIVSIDMSDRTTCIVNNSGELKCWGDNGFGQLGIENTDRIGNNASEMGTNLASVDLGSGRTAVMVSSATYSTCVLLDNSTVKCWGNDEVGNLGLEMNAYGDHPSETVASLSNIDLGTGHYAKDIFAGRYHVCAILMDNSMKCFGYGNSGRLGYGNTGNQGDNPNEMGDNLGFVDLGAGLYATQGHGGSSHSCAVLNSGAVKCWGDGANGRRGSGNQADRGDGANEMGNNLASVNLGVGVTAQKLEIGDNFTCILQNDNQIKCWGHNGSGRLGIGSTAQKGHNGSTTPDTYGTVNLGSGRSAKDFAVGYQHVCAILDNDRVKCWGEAAYGRLGAGNQTDRGASAAHMGDALTYVDLGTGRTAKQITAGFYHTCALLDNDSVKCWGYNSHGQLGIGHAAHMGDAAGEMGDNLPTVILPAEDKVREIYAAGWGSCLVTEQNEIKCWGRNSTGELGHGHNYNVGTDPLSMGSNLPTTY